METVRELTRLSIIKAKQCEKLRKRCPLLSVSSTFFPKESEALYLAEQIGTTSDNEESNFKRFENAVQPCQERPQSLDFVLSKLTSSLIKRVHSPWASRGLYLLCKIRGRKAVARTLPRLVGYLEESLGLLESECWETRYVALVWLSILVLVPFAIESIIENDDPVSFILARCEVFLDDSKATREPAALCIARLLTRPDSMPQLERFLMQTSHSSNKLGWLMAKAEIFKRGIGSHIGLMAEKNVEDAILQTESAFLHSSNSSSLHRKLHMKILQRVILASLVVREDSVTLERTFGLLIGSGISDTDYVVRWSAAKGIARICERLNRKELALDVCDSVLSLFSSFGEHDDAGWNGACLTIAELCRTQIIRTPEHIDATLVNCVEKALEFDRKRGTRSLGSNVRDAACYVCWALVRKAPLVFVKVHSQSLYRSLVVTSLFDREVSCRRAAAAALQECVGRLGRSSFPKGIETIQILDYQAIGNINRSYQEFAATIASLRNYENIHKDLMEHLLETKARHWDENIRELASHAIGGIGNRCLREDNGLLLTYLTRLSSRLLSSKQSNRTDVHGATLAYAQLAVTVKDKASGAWQFLQKDAIAIIRALIHSDLAKFVDIRTAICKLIEKIASLEIITEGERVDLIDGFVQQQLSTCLSAGSINSSTSLIGLNVTTKLTAEDTLLLTSARGAIVAILKFAHSSVQDNVLLEEWCRTLNVYGLHGAILAGSKSSSSVLKSLQLILSSKTISYHNRVESLRAIADSEYSVSMLLPLIIQGMEDYQTTNQGDVGSWVRKEACETLIKLFQRNHHIRDHQGLKEKVAFLACEKLDHVRESAGRAAKLLILGRYNNSEGSYDNDEDNENDHSQQAHPKLRHHFDVCYEILLEGLSSEDLTRNIRYSVIKGLAITAGSLSESPGHAAKDCLFRFYHKHSSFRREFWDGLLDAIRSKEYRSETRIVPLLKTVGQLLTECIPNIEQREQEDRILTSSGSCLFCTALVEELSGLTANTKSVPRLVAIAPILLGMSSLGHLRAWHLLVKIITHHMFPTVRKQTADLFYMWGIGILNPVDSTFNRQGGDLELCLDKIALKVEDGWFENDKLSIAELEDFATDLQRAFPKSALWCKCT
jgi:hypothetical protein